MIELSSIQEGDTVLVATVWGTGPTVEATVQEVHSNIKNGRPGIDYVTRSGAHHWAYLDQVQSIIDEEGGAHG